MNMSAIQARFPELVCHCVNPMLIKVIIGKEFSNSLPQWTSESSCWADFGGREAGREGRRCYEFFWTWG
jgi:hypothetical protein